VIALRTGEEITKLRQSADILVNTFVEVAKALVPGMTTKELDLIAEKTIRSRGGRPAFKGYSGYPASICVSVDQEVVHGIPGKRRLQDGSLVSIDIGVEWGGYFSDAAKTYILGEVDRRKAELSDVTRKALWEGIKKCLPGRRLSDLSHAIQVTVEKAGFSVVRDLVGHGVGRELHESPQIPNFGPKGQGPLLQKGMVLAIEPMVNMGGFEVVVLDDGWTVVTVDGQPSAHFEHTVLITDGEPEVLTLGIE